MTRIAFALLFAVSVAAVAEDKPVGKPVFEVTQPKDTILATKVGKWTAPVKYTEWDLLKQWTDAKTRDALSAQVDLKTHDLLVFCWQGSGGDKLTYTVAESFPEQVAFALKPGATDDLRTHVKLFAVRKNVSWSAK